VAVVSNKEADRVKGRHLIATAVHATTIVDIPHSLSVGEVLAEINIIKIFKHDQYFISHDQFCGHDRPGHRIDLTRTEDVVFYLKESIVHHLLSDSTN
jgi:hypothetical protein